MNKNTGWSKNTSLKIDCDGFEVVFDTENYQISEFESKISEIDKQLSSLQTKVDKYNEEIERLTNHSDGFDYMIAVGSGIIAGLIDSFFVGEWNFLSAKAWSNETVNRFVQKTAESTGFKGGSLNQAIKHLEDNFGIPSDNVWKDSGKGINARSHHLDDFAHHPSLVGLICSIVTQFTKQSYFSNSLGQTITLGANGNLIGSDFPSKIFCGIVNWAFHLVSDMSGSHKTAGVGMGIPGPILSIIKEISAIPGINKTGLPQFAKDAFVKSRFDLRSELACIKLVGKQAIPVIINECIVRGFYFIRHLVSEIRSKNPQSLNDFLSLEWKRNILPFNNRTITRMLTISTGTFCAVDLADAAIRSAIKNGGQIQNPKFLSDFILRVNFVGIGRFAMAVVSDIRMETQREKFRDERIKAMNESLHLLNAKTCYRQAEAWVEIKELDQLIHSVEEKAQVALAYAEDSLVKSSNDFEEIKSGLSRIRESNPDFTKELLDILES